MVCSRGRAVAQRARHATSRRCHKNVLRRHQSRRHSVSERGSSLFLTRSLAPGRPGDLLREFDKAATKRGRSWRKLVAGETRAARRANAAAALARLPLRGRARRRKGPSPSLQNGSHTEQASASHAIGAFLYFLYLLEGNAELLAQSFLREAFGQAMKFDVMA